jgi:Glyoxalase superfamily protein
MTTAAKGRGHMRPGIERTFHNSKCMEVIDPFGNRLRFDETLTTIGAPLLPAEHSVEIP